MNTLFSQYFWGIWVKRCRIPCLTLASVGILNPAAMAQYDAAVHFNSTVLQPTCTASVNGGGEDATITLDPILMSDLPSQGDAAGDKTFTFDFSGCGVGHPQKAKVFFYNTTPGQVTHARLNGTGTGAGWQFQLLPASNDTQIPVRTHAIPINNPNDFGVSINTGSGTVSYRVRYYRSSPTLTMGTKTATVNYLIYYQ